MSTNSNDQKIVAESRVLTTKLSGPVLSWAVLFVLIGAVVGAIVMGILNAGVIEMLFKPKESAAIEIVAHYASNEESGETEEKEIPSVNDKDYADLKPILDELEVEFPSGSDAEYRYEAKEHEFTLKNLDALKARLPDVEVLYLNDSNKQTNAGTYYVAAIVSCKGYRPEVIEGSFTINKAKFDTNLHNLFKDLTVIYDGQSHKIELENEELPNGVEPIYRNNEATEHGVYFATVELSAENYETEILCAVLKIIDISKLVSFNGYNAEEDAVVLTYNGKEQSVNLNVEELKKLGEFTNAETGETKVQDVVYTGNSFKYPGTYDVTAKVVVEGFGEADVSVKVIVKPGDIKNVYGITWRVDSSSYDGNQKSVIVKSSAETLPENITYTIKYYLVTVEGENTVYTESEVCNPGNYRAVIELIDSTGHCLNNNEENENLINYDFTITKRSITGGFSIEDVSTKYALVESVDENGETVEVDRVNNLEMVFHVDRLPDTILDQPLVVTYKYGDASLVVTFRFAIERVKDKYGDYVQDYVIYYYIGDETEDEYKIYRSDNGEHKFIIPVDFVNVGTYYMTVEVKGNDFDADIKLYPTVFIDYAKLSDKSITNIASTQKVVADGKLHLPDVGKLANGITYEMYDQDGNLIEGYKYLGKHKITIVFTKGNYQTTKTVTLHIRHNWWIIAYGAIAGVLAGTLVGLYFGLRSQKKEKESNTHFRAPGTIIANTRGGIICESYAMYNGTKCEGRLYLSSTALEFYADDYKELTNNFLIDIDEIRNVSSDGINTIFVRANKKDYTFTVPYGSAGEWAHHITQA